MFHIKSLILRFLQRQGIKNQIEAVEVSKIANNILKESFGTKDVKTLFFKNGTLQIKCSNSLLANEIYLSKERIKIEINEKLHKVLVKHILVKIG